jgi:WD40 repeat protein
VALGPDGSVIATLAHEMAEGGFTSFPTGVVVEARDDGQVLASFDGGRSVAFDPTGSLLAVGVVDSILLVDCSTWKIVRTIQVDGYTPTQLLWVHDGRQLISNGAEQAVNGDRHFDVIDVDAGAVAAQGPDDVAGVAVSPDGAVLALGLEGGEVRLMDFDADGTFGETPLATMIGDPFRVSGLSFSPDGSRLVTSGMRSTIVWDVRSTRAPRQVQVVSDLPAWAFADFAPSDVLGVPTTARGTWGLVAFRPSGSSFILAGGSGAVEMPDFDPALACRQSTPADRLRLEALLGAPSACLRVPGLMDEPAP